MQVIQSKTIPEAYQKLIQTILDNGEWVNDERGTRTLEVLNIVTNIQEPLPYSPVPVPVYDLIQPSFETFWTGERLMKYCEEFISPDRAGFIYTYGNRYREWFGVDQIQEAIKRLNNCNETRRAISTTWDAKTDTINDEVPCMILVDFKIRHNKLYTTALWRSHDIGQAWYANAVGLTYLAQYVAKNTNSTVGEITIQSISAHIYEDSLNEAKQLLI